MTGPPVLLLHSGGASPRQWRRLVALLEPTHRVLAPELIGYGAADPWPNGKPFHFRDDVARLESLVVASGGAAHVVGHSYGGLLALQLALARPELVRSIAVYEPVAFGVLDAADPEDAAALAQLHELRMTWEPDADGIDGDWLAAFVGWWNGPGAWERLAPVTRDEFRAVAWKVYQEVVSLSADRTDSARYGTITAPTLLLGGARTRLSELRVLAKLAAALPAARLELLAELGHMGPMTHAAQVNPSIAAHIAENDAGAKS